MKIIFVLFLVCSFMLPSVFAAAPQKMPKKAVLTADDVKALGFAGQKFTKKSNGVWKLANGITVYSTESYGAKIRGYAGPTPLYIAVDAQNKIAGIAPAPNMETDEYFVYLKKGKLFQKWNGKTLKEAATFKPDAITGATYSSKAVISTVNISAGKIGK